MSKVKPQDNVVVFFAILYSSNFDISSFKKKLSKKFGEVLYITEPTLFKHTSYYNEEMGNTLRIFIFYKKKINKNSLIKLKKFSDHLENKYLIEGKRTVNVDPGLFSKENVILATNKGYTHRIYLDKGVYADLTLYYKDKSYNSLDWTFKEYKSIEIISLFNSLRYNLL